MNGRICCHRVLRKWLPIQSTISHAVLVRVLKSHPHLNFSPQELSNFHDHPSFHLNHFETRSLLMTTPGAHLRKVKYRSLGPSTISYEHDVNTRHLIWMNYKTINSMGGDLDLRACKLASIPSIWSGSWFMIQQFWERGQQSSGFEHRAFASNICFVNVS